MALSLGELVAELSADASQLDAGLAEGRQKMADFGGSAATLLGGAGVVAGGAFIASTMAAIDREAVADTAAAAYGDPAVAAKAGQAAGKLYSGGWGASLEEVNDSVNAVITSIGDMGNASQADIEKMTAKLMDVSKVMKLDVGRTAQVVGQMVKSGLVENSTQGLDMLTATLQKVPANVREDIMDAVDEYGPFMQSIGVKGEEAFGLLLKASEKGMYGIDKTGDALKEFTIRATDMSAASKVGFDALGLSQEEMAGKILKGGDTAKGAFDKIITGLLSIKDPVKQSQAALALFGTPLEDLNASEMPKFLASLQAGTGGIGKFAGAADRLSATVNDNAATNIESFKRQVMSAFVDVLGNRALPAVSAVALYLATNFGPGLQRLGAILTGQVIPAIMQTIGWINQYQTPIMIIAGIIAGVFIPYWVALGVTAMASATVQAAAWVMAQVRAVASAAVQSASIVMLIGRMVVMGAVAMAQGAMVAAGWLLALGPIGLLIAATVLVVGLIIANWGRVKGWLGAFWGWLKSGFSAMASFIVAAARMGFLGPVPWIIANWTKISNFFRALPGRVVGFFNTLASGVVGAARRGFLGPVAWIIANWGKVTNTFRELPGKVTGYLAGLPGRMYSAGQNIIRSLANGMASMASAAVDRVRGIVSDIAGLIPGSPVKTGPLRSLNNGRAGREIVRMLAGGIGAEGGRVRDALSAALDVPGARPGPGGLRTTAGGLGAAGAALRVILDVAGADEAFTRAIRETVRVKGQGNSQAAFGRNSVAVGVMG